MKKLLLILIFLLSTALFAQNYVADITFGSNGAVFNNGVNFYPEDVLLVNDNYYFISQKKVGKVNYTGAIDTSFGTDGFITLDGNGVFYFIKGFKYIGNYFYLYGSVYDSESSNDIFICKIDEDGNFDTSFGTNNFARIDFESAETINDLVIDADGNLFCIGSRDAYNPLPSLLIYFKINPNGTLNTAFDANGYKSLLLNYHSYGNYLYPYGDNYLLIGKDIIYNSNPQLAQQKLYISMVNNNGSLITTFGTNGSVTASLSEGAICNINDVELLDNNLYVNFFHEQSDSANGSNLLKFNLTTQETVYNIAVQYVYDMQVESNGINITGISLCEPETDIFCERDFQFRKKFLNGEDDTATTPYTYSFPTTDIDFPGYSDDQSVKIYKDLNGKILLAGVSTIYNGGSGFSAVRLQETPLSTEIIIKNDLSVYPNPFKDIVTIDGNNDKIKNIQIIDIGGRIIFSQNFSSSYISKTTVNLYTIQQPGVYTIKITTIANDVFTKKIIKQ